MSIHQLLLSIALAFSLVVVNIGSVALAKEGSLILPSQPDSNVEFVLQNKLTDSDPAEILQVFVGKQTACCAGKSPIAGRYAVAGNTVTFDPVFDFIKGQYYTVMISDKDAGNNSIHELSEFAIEPDSEAIRPEVVMIYPSGDDFPENTLRFYVHFSTPMKPHLSTQFIKLVDANGVSDTAAFMAFKQELWSEDRKRLTLLMDPGRIKRGVAQNLALGPALLQGNNYSLVIEAGWPSASGEHTMPGFEKSFSVSKALRTLPDTNSWAIVPPEVLTREPLLIEFDRPFDYQLVESSITVLDKAGQLIPGAVSIERHEKTWRFEPQNVWKEKLIQIVVDARLEDVAGNNFKDLLDHSVKTETKSIDQQVFTVELKEAPKSVRVQ